jgi:hypothetical protein
MPVEMLTYAALAERLRISPEATRAQHRLPRSRSNDGRALVSVDLQRSNTSPCSAGGWTPSP